MHLHDPWGASASASFDVVSSSATDDDDKSLLRDVDRAALHAAAAAAAASDQSITQQSWLLDPQAQCRAKAKKTPLAAVRSKKQQQQQQQLYVDLGCVVCKRKLLYYLLAAFAAALLISALAALVVKLVPHRHAPPPPEDKYTRALRKALLFFDAQKSGKLPKQLTKVPWRGSSALTDGSSHHVDLTGGFYDAGDNIKFGFPGAFALTVLSWSTIEYSPKYAAMGELEHVKELIKWGTDYMLKTFNASAPTVDHLWGQVGNGGRKGENSPNDHYCWERPEDMDYDRPAYSCEACSDLAAEMAAAMAAAAIVFKDNPLYSHKLVQGAQALYHFAWRKLARYVEAIPEAQHFYNSSGYWDELIWGGAWLYYATGNLTYLELVTQPSIAEQAGSSGGWKYYGVFDWDNKLTGAQVVLTRLRMMINPGYPYEDGLKEFYNETNLVMCSYLPRYNVFEMSRGGLMQFNYGNPQPLQYVASAAFLSAIYADYMTASDVPGWNCGPDFMPKETLQNFARSQIDYILGNNPENMSYVVGFGDRYPTQVHHRGASIPDGKSSKGCTVGYRYRDSKSPNPHVVVGAMVAGPDKHDRFLDVRSNYNHTEPTLAGNACLVAALVALSGADNQGGVDPNTIFSSVPPLYPSSPPPPAPWKP